jgi:hypothetical protein
MDADVLAAPEQASELAAALDALGFVPTQGDSKWHLQPRTSAGAVQIEVHRAVAGFDSPESVPWGDSRPLEGWEPLLALAPQDHAWTVLCQATRKHPDRRTRIRDLFMLKQALAACSEAGRAALFARVASDPLQSELREMLGRAGCGDFGQATGSSEKRLRRLYLMQSRVSSVPRGPTAWLLRTIAVNSVAIGTAPNWRLLTRLRHAAGPRPWSPRSLLRIPAFATATLVALLLTADAPLVPESANRS